MGNNNPYRINIVKNNPIDAKSLFISYSAILDYYGILGKQNPCRNEEFHYYFTCLLAEKIRIKVETRTVKTARPLWAEEVEKILFIKESDPVFNVVFKSSVALCWFKAVTVVAFAFIFRVDEVFSLQFQDISLILKNYKKNLCIDLHDRKSSQFIVSQFHETCCNPIPIFDDYILALQKLNKPMEKNCFVFPMLGISSNILSTKASSGEYSKILR